MKSVFVSAGAAFALALSCFAAPALAEDAAPSCQLHRAAYLDIVPDHGMRPLIKVTLNGTLEYFLIDTAGIYSAVSPKVAEDLKLETKLFKTNLVHLTSGQVPDHIAYVDHMVIGHLPLPRMSLVVMTPGEVSSDSQGLISGEFLHLFDLEIDPAASKLSLFLHNACPEHVVHWTNGPRAVLDFRMNRTSNETANFIARGGPDWHVIVPAKLDGRDVSVTIDTGATTSVIQYGDFKDMMYSDATAMNKLKRIDKNADEDRAIYSYPFKTLNFDGINVSNPEVKIFPGERNHAEKVIDYKPQLILGQDVLSKLHIYIAYKDKKIYITPAGAH